MNRLLPSLFLSFMLIVAACGGPASPAVVDPGAAPSPTPVSQPAVASPDPSASPPAPSEPSPAPTATPRPTKPSTGNVAPSKPAPPIPTTWSKARVVLSGQCWSPTSTVDQAGAFHVVATCGTRIRYATSTDGKTWRAGTFSRPVHHRDVEPQLAVDGSTLYVAFTRLRETDGGCGDDGLEDVGVYYRTKALPSGAWSSPIRIGAAGDHMQSFRVVDGVIHETYMSRDGEGPLFYGSLSSGTFRSVKIPGAESTSLRVGDDGQARIAYTTSDSVRYATVRHDGRLSIRSLFRSRVMQLSSPSLVLGAGDRAFVAWTATPRWGGGCADGAEDVSKPGIYVATDSTGSWLVKRISKVEAAATLTLDVDRARLSVAFATASGAREMTRRANGRWSGARISGTRNMEQPVLRRDSKTGHLLLVATYWHEGGSRNDIVAFVKS
jgi:hypothetical protein